MGWAGLGSWRPAQWEHLLFTAISAPSGALWSCLGRQEDHALRVVKAPRPGVAPGNELTKSWSCEGPGSGNINMTGLP